MTDQYSPNKLKLLIRNQIYEFLYKIDQLFQRKNEILILCYHSICKDNWLYSVDPETFKEQIIALKKEYTFVNIEELDGYLHKKNSFSKPACLISFDDGYKDILSIKDFLYKEDINPVVFLLTNHKKVDRVLLETERPFLSNLEILKLIKLGWKIGSHTVSHTDLKDIRPSSKNSQIIKSKKELELKYSKKIKYIAYPWGRYDEAVLKIVRKAKYRLGFTMDDGQINRNSNPLSIPRVGVDRSHTGKIFLYTISPSVIAFRKVVKKFINF